jgi:hypothetical protein
MKLNFLISNGANILVLNVSTSSFQGIHSRNLGIQTPLEVSGEVYVINQNILSLGDLISLFFVFLVGWKFECFVFLGFMFVGWRASTN